MPMWVVSRAAHASALYIGYMACDAYAPVTYGIAIGYATNTPSFYLIHARGMEEG